MGSCPSNQVSRMRYAALLAILLSETVVGQRGGGSSADGRAFVQIARLQARSACMMFLNS